MIGFEDKFKLPFSVIKKRLKLLIDLYNEKEAGEIHNWISIQSESLNDEGLVALKGMNRRHFNERKELLSNPKFNGKKKVAIGHFSTTLIEESDCGANKRVLQ